MGHYTIYQVATGEIVDCCEMPEGDLAANLGEGQDFLTGKYAVGSYVSGEVVFDLPPKPTEWHVFDYYIKQWIDTAPDHIAQIKATAINKVNQTSGQIRSQFVTVIPAQDMIYQNKESEAKAYLADSDPVLAAYPFIAAEIGITAPTAFEVAQVYVNMAHVLRVQASGLEHIRLSTITAIESASDASQVANAISGFEAALAA